MASPRLHNEMPLNKTMLFEDLLYFTYFSLLLQLQVPFSLMASAYIILIKQEETFL